MNNKYAALFLLLPCFSVYADGGRIGVEVEVERNGQSGITNRALTVAPGWDFAAGSLISSVELLVEENRDGSVDNTGVRMKENKLFLRLRHDGELTDRLGYYMRGGVGRSSNNVRDFRYAYVEPGLEYDLGGRWSWAVAYRQIGTIDGTSGQNVRKLYLGPSFDLDKNNEFEFRYVRGTGDQDVKAWVVEYVHKF